MIANHEQEHAVVHFVVVVLNMLCIAPIVVFFFGGGARNWELSWLIAVSFLSWLLLLVLTLILIVTSRAHRRLALTGMLATLGLYMLTGFGMPSIT